MRKIHFPDAIPVYDNAVAHNQLLELIRNNTKFQAEFGSDHLNYNYVKIGGEDKSFKFYLKEQSYVTLLSYIKSGTPQELDCNPNTYTKFDVGQDFQFRVITDLIKAGICIDWLPIMRAFPQFMNGIADCLYGTIIIKMKCTTEIVRFLIDNHQITY